MEAVNVFKNSILAYINAFQQNDAFYVEASCLLHSAKQLAGFFMKHCTELIWVKTKHQIHAAFYHVLSLSDFLVNIHSCFHFYVELGVIH